MQGFSVESKTFRISSSSTLWQDLEARTSHAMKQTWLQEARDSTREDKKLRGPNQKSVESCETRSYVQLGEKLTTYMQKGETTRRLGNRHHTKEAASWACMGPGRPAQPSLGPVCSLLWPSRHSGYLWTGVESHASSNSSSAAEEQRRQGHHPEEERVELVD
jgi:hypothetical protein